MGRWLEYDEATGRILSEVSSEDPPETTDGYGLLKINEYQEIDTSLYGVRDGQLVKLYETNAEKQERERIRREHLEKVRSRLKGMTYELCIAMLDDNDAAVKNLKAEFREMKAYL